MEWVSTFKERFAELVGEEPYRVVGPKLGISKATVGSYITGKREPKRPVLLSIAHAYGVDPLWLSGADVPKYSFTRYSSAENLQPVPDLVKVPRLGAIACGEPILAEENIECYDAVPAWANCDFTLVCKGDSMIGARIYDGDIVCIRSQPYVDSGDIAAVLIGDEATLKRIRVFEDHIILEPENPNYRPKTFWDSEMEQIHILGKATHFISAIR